jgi:hypothetical protein
MHSGVARAPVAKYSLRCLTRRSAVGAFVVLVLLGPPGCYADSVPVPEPTLTTPGAFIAVPFEPAQPSAGQSGEAGQAGAAGAPGSSSGGAPGSGGSNPSDSERWQLIRVVAVLDTGNDLAIFHFPYGFTDSLEEAREATHSRPSSPPPYVAITSLGRLESLGAVVVGYRSLTQEEQDVIR